MNPNLSLEDYFLCEIKRLKAGTEQIRAGTARLRDENEGLSL
jgi:hypothetical protein